MKTNFNQVVNRHNTGSVKWDFIERYLQLDGSDLLPMWVSDFDFPCPAEVQQALHSRVEHGIFGYSERDAQYYQAVMDWFSNRHNLQLKREWFTSIEGVVPGLAILIQLLSKPGDAVVVQGPYYGSFAKIITMNGREVIENPLTESLQGYQFDFDHLEACFEQQKPPLLLLCNPHNPTGRCWTHSELTQLMTLCRTHGVTVISDEIWADLLLPGQTFTSVLHLDAALHDHVISATSASKTFGLSSLRISNFLIPNAATRNAFIDRLNAHGLDVFNALSMTAATAAYQHGEAWLDDLLRYLAENRRWFEQALAYAAPWCKMTRAEGTYLAWLDCRALDLEDDALQQALIHESKIAPSMGNSFGLQGNGFIRINLGCPRQYLEDAIRGLAKLKP
ncbi:MalY/PatB family protein [Serratia entomophila]|uniref:MalY/PatB family protein n=1 Tax=Serratia entomophila TaxID=42906 RepID=UPI001F4BE89E|nr:MalY/PatB family protein [Serratia entomophila]ULG11545.1 aminotransferase [Serratia entomophila]CAI1172658.1 Cystathionine beta-lyase PatB [Serratia entomophila]CAI1188296.1 Cystathionine beta-lyase PatB [Serratia entomophila]CAI1977226.1 Cystathionine beta-lyase PatB [Serratia entomophila]CAI1988217.1 Cystathionine beta-lyase PatB [Serratia entomophila]